MNLSDQAVRRTLSAAQSVVVKCLFGTMPTPRELETVHRGLTDLLIIACARESGSACGSEELKSVDDLVDTKTAAEEIGCSAQWVREIRDCLGAIRVGRDWRYPRRNVIDYANERRCR
jgi:hypothetical protein